MHCELAPKTTIKLSPLILKTTSDFSGAYLTVFSLINLKNHYSDAVFFPNPTCYDPAHNSFFHESETNN